MNKELTELINEIITQKTFSADALEGIQRLKAKAESLERELEKVNSDFDMHKRAAAAIKESYEQLREENKALKTRCENIENRERAQNVNDVKLVCEKEKTGLVLQMFNTVFKNTVVREQIHKSETMLAGNPPYPQQNQPSSITKTMELE